MLSCQNSPFKTKTRGQSCFTGKTNVYIAILNLLTLGAVVKGKYIEYTRAYPIY